MATLTTSWENYAKWQWNPGTGFKITFYLDAKYSSQSIVNNNTNVQTRLTSVVNSGSGSGSNYKFTCTYCSTVSGSGSWTFASETITSGSNPVKHNDDGTKSISLKATVKVANAGLSEHTLSATVTLPTIPRKATVTSAPNFTDIDNPTITYSNPAGNSVTTLQASIYLPDATTGLAYYRDIPKTGTEYRFDLTNEERERLRTNCTTANSRAVRFYIRTVLGGTNYTHNLEKTLTIVNANPTINNMTFQEQNNDVINYLGSSSANTLIAGVSSVLVTADVTLKKHATKKTFAFQPVGSATGVDYQMLYDVPESDSNSIIFLSNLRDSRNLDAETYSVTKTVIPYRKVKQNSFSFKRVNPTSSNITFTLDSVYYQQTFGSTANAPTIKWKLDDGSWNTLTSSQYTIDTTNNKVTVNITLNNAISYMNNGTFYVEVSDLLSTWTNSMNVTKGIPVFEYGEDDVQVNGDLYIADTNRENKINVGEELEKIDTNIMTAYFTSNYTISATSTYYKLPINSNKAVGTKLTLDTTNHNIVIGSGVSKIKVSAKVCFNTIASSGDKWLTVYKNNESVSANPRNLTGRDMIYSTVMLVDVQPNDTIYFSVYGTRNDVIRADIAYTNLTVEVVE